MSLYKAYFVPESVDPYGLHDPIFDPFRDKIKKEIARLKGMSSCLLDETGLGNFLSQLELALSRTTFVLSGTQIRGLVPTRLTCGQGT